MNNSYVDYIIELLSPFGSITSKFMFGGCAIYKDGIIIGIIVDNELFFKVDDSNKRHYELYGSAPFMYKAKGRHVALSYWKVPEEILEQQDKLLEWLTWSYEISNCSKKFDFLT